MVLTRLLAGPDVAQDLLGVRGQIGPAALDVVGFPDHALRVDHVGEAAWDAVLVVLLARLSLGVV